MVNWGIIGFGRMGKIFANCFENSNSFYNLNCIASKSYSNSNFKKKICKNYDELINSTDIDAVYVSTLNNTHKDLVIKLINQNKKILCEKPLGLNSIEVNEI